MEIKKNLSFSGEITLFNVNQLILEAQPQTNKQTKKWSNTLKQFIRQIVLSGFDHWSLKERTCAEPEFRLSWIRCAVVITTTPRRYNLRFFLHCSKSGTSRENKKKNSHRRYSIKKGVIKIFAIFTGKRLYWGLF